MPSESIGPPSDCAYEPCSNCGGSGLVMYLTGAHDCPECKGACLVRARDERGRFTSAS